MGLHFFIDEYILCSLVFNLRISREFLLSNQLSTFYIFLNICLHLRIHLKIERLLRVPCTARRSNQPILKEIKPGISLEGMMLKLKLQYFGHLMERVDSLEKTLMLGGIRCRRRRGWQRKRWLDGITDSMHMGFGGVGDGQGGLVCCDSRGRKESDATEQLNWTELSVWFRGLFSISTIIVLLLNYLLINILTRFSFKDMFCVYAYMNMNNLKPNAENKPLQRNLVGVENIYKIIRNWNLVNNSTS